MLKKSALMIVCNGAQFIEAQLKHIYSVVDEIVIVEGADVFFQKVIKSKRSNDGTIEIIDRFIADYDADQKVKLINVGRSKNIMVRVGNEVCTGDLIYQVDVDEFLRHETINAAFERLKKHNTVSIPQRSYFKWPDRYLSGARDYSIRDLPIRFFKNRLKDGLRLNHIPQAYYSDEHKKVVFPKSITHLPLKDYAYHFMAIFRKQLEDKMKYYAIRDGVPAMKVARRLADFDRATREPQFRIPSYRGTLCVEKKPFPLKKIRGRVVLEKP